MNRYTSRSGKQSGVMGYDIEPNGIVVYFHGGGVYRYTVNDNGQAIINHMINLANGQMGLQTFINQNNPRFHKLA